MRRYALALVVLAACGGKSSPQPQPQPVAQAEPEPTGDDFGGEPYGGDTYGGDHGYGGDTYGGWDGGPPPPPPVPVAPDLTGTWVGPCASANGVNQRLTFVATTDRWDLNVESFKDTGCATRTQALHLGGPYALGEQSTAVAGAWDATFTFDAREITVDDAKTAKAVGKACKLKKLKKGQTVSLHAQGCAKLGLKAASACAAEHSLVSRSGSRVSFGARPADNDLCAVEKRPTTLDSYELAYQWAATGIAECDAYVQAIDRYLNCPQMPRDARDQVFDAIKQAVPMFSQMGTSAAEACKQGLDAMAPAMQSVGC